MTQVQNAKDDFAKIFSSLPEGKQKELYDYYDVRSENWFFRKAKEHATNIKYRADRHGYGQGECWFYFSNNDDDNSSEFEKMGDELAKVYFDLAESYFDMLFEVENS